MATALVGHVSTCRARGFGVDQGSDGRVAAQPVQGGHQQHVIVAMLSPVERLRFRPEALDDLVWDGLIVAREAGDERVVSITSAGEDWLRHGRDQRWAGPNGEVEA